jgi:Kef-type K+ transport system membrane component KefB
MADSPLAQVLLTLAAIILVGQVLGTVLKRLGQPRVIGEVLAGIMLGPSLLGWLSRDWFGFQQSPLISPEALPHLATIADLGIVLYMFLVGVEFNTDAFRKLAKSAALISAASLLVPFALGVLLGSRLHDQLSPQGVSQTSFALFFGISLAVTAFPVLSRILTDRGVAQTELGVLALSCAAVADVAAWWLLALVAGVVTAEAHSAFTVLALSVLYIAFMLLVVRPLAAHWIHKIGASRLGPTEIAIIFAALLLSALTTERIGIHAVFGAFLLGVVIPHDSHTARSLKAGLEQVVTVLLLPAFFAYMGMRTEIGLVSGSEQWLLCGVIIAVASLGKFGGTLAASRLAGFDWRTGSALGVLMNTRGLMELIVLNVGLDLGVISSTLFAMLVLMALVTTLATTPILAWLEPSYAVVSAGKLTLAPRH